MNRKILVQVTAPAVVIGMLLFGAYLVGARYMNRLQENRGKIVKEHVLSLEAAQELETHLRQLRFYLFLFLLDGDPQHTQRIDHIHQDFEESLNKARLWATTEEEWVCIHAIEAGYQNYHDELARLQDEVAREGPRKIEPRKVEESHPIRHVVEPCREYYRLNKVSLSDTSQESDAINQRMQLGMLLLGLGGPISGLIVGYGMARGLSRSIYQLRVRVQDAAQRLDQSVGSVSLTADGDLQGLDRQMQNVVQRVAEVTERLQQQQRELLRAEQLSAVGQLAASVAHEVRNPLTAVKLLVESALRPGNDRPLSHDDLEVIHGEVLRLEQTVQSFLDFARLPTPRRVGCHLEHVVTQAADLVRAHARQQHVDIVVHGRGLPLPANVDRGQMQTVFVNLFLNALDAMPYGGRLEIEMESSPDRPLNGESVFHRLRVQDNGAGILPEILPRLFTPFTSSKPTGTGLGLSICQRILEEHGGTITAANRAEGGACFTILLPAIPEQKPVVHAAPLLTPDLGVSSHLSGSRPEGAPKLP